LVLGHERKNAIVDEAMADGAARQAPHVRAGPGVYSAVLHYLKTVEALRSDADGKAIVAKMKEMPTDDPLFSKGSVRPDGRKIHQAFLFEVKRPAESRYVGATRMLLPMISARVRRSASVSSADCGSGMPRVLWVFGRCEYASPSSHRET
jgi:hypothetical protein